MSFKEKLIVFAIRNIGRFLIVVALFNHTISTLMRVYDAIESKRYSLTEGEVSSVTSYTESTHTRGGTSYVTRYNIWVEYEVEDSSITGSVSINGASWSKKKGTVVPVMYRDDNPYIAYAAKKDWLTGKYLPIENSYNFIMIFTIILFVVGVLVERALKEIFDKDEADNKKST